MRKRTRLDHEERIEEAVRYIVEHLDDPLGPAQLADKVCLSRFHFHRVFQALVGETVGEMTRRVRLERAAHQLRTSEQPITEIAFSAGYATHEAFIRAFRAAFGSAPSTFRRKFGYRGDLPTPNGVHFCGLQEFQLRFVALPGETSMRVTIKEIPARRAVCIRHKGPYFMIGASFSALASLMNELGIQGGLGVGIFHDDPNVTPIEELRSDAGKFVPSDFQIDDPRLHIVDLPGGTYAVHTHIGHYEGLGTAWGEFGGKWFPRSGYEMANVPPFEVYVKDCTYAPIDEVRTDLYMAIKPAAVPV